jgi:cell division septation protein DedD
MTDAPARQSTVRLAIIAVILSAGAAGYAVYDGITFHHRISVELDHRSAARDAKEAAANAKTGRDICGLLHDLPATKHTDAVRLDLHCLAAAPSVAPSPTPPAPVVPATAATSPAAPTPTTAGPTVRPTPSATASRPVRSSSAPPSPTSVPTPTPKPSGLCVLPLIGSLC